MVTDRYFKKTEPGPLGFLQTIWMISGQLIFEQLAKIAQNTHICMKNKFIKIVHDDNKDT